MINTIQKELQLAESKKIKEIKFEDYTLVKLTTDNVAIVEAMIKNDSAYIRASDKKAEPYSKGNKKYGGSTAYWMTQLKEKLFAKNNKYTYKDIIRGAVEAVDRENSTHLNADKVGRDEITKRICNISKSKLIKCLKDPEHEDMFLIREIARKTSASKGARINLSFASKFCHYACFYIFENTKYQDNYSIYDNILRKALPLYLKYYGIKEYDLSDYKEYRKAVDAVRKASGAKISRNGFDHLLWYYHKARIEEIDNKNR